MGAEEAEEEHNSSEQKQPAHLAAAFALSRFVVPGLLWSGRGHTCLFGILVDEVVNAQFEVGAVEFLG